MGTSFGARKELFIEPLWEVCGRATHAQNVKCDNHSKATDSNDAIKEEEAALAGVGAPAPFIAIQPFPALLDLPLGSDAVKASCGSRHTAVVTREWAWLRVGQYSMSLFSWGPHFALVTFF